MAVDVLFIGGSSRSGSTLLEAFLSSIPRVTAIGELADLWPNMKARGYRCGCGTSLASCRMWSAVVARAFGNSSEFDHWYQLQRRVLRRSMLPLQLAGSLDHSDALSEYRLGLQRIYDAIAEETGATLVVDSSKRPHYAYAVFGIPGSNVKSIHLIRDSRAVAYSWQRRKLRPESPTGELMPIHGQFRSSAEWIVANAIVPVYARRFRVPILRLRYEDFASDPASSIKILASFLALPLEVVSNQLFRNGSEYGFVQRPFHSAGGNPSRYTEGPVTIKSDDEWRTHFRGLERAATSVLTYPLLKGYGYKIR